MSNMTSPRLHDASSTDQSDQLRNSVNTIGEVRTTLEDADSYDKEFVLKMLNERDKYHAECLALRTRVEDLEGGRYSPRATSNVTFFKNKLRESDQMISSLESAIHDQKSEHSQRAFEIEKLQNKMKIMEREHQQSLADLKRSLELEHQALLDAELHKLAEKYEKDRELLEGQIKNLKSRGNEHENKMAISQAKEEKLYSNLQAKSQEIEALKARIEALEKEKEYELDRLRMQFETEKRFLLQNEIKEFENKLNEERNNYEARIKEIKASLFDSEIRLTNANSESTHLTLQIEEKKREIESWKQKYHVLERSIQDQLGEAKKYLDSMKQANQFNAELDKRSHTERSALQDQNNSLSMKIQELENRLLEANRECNKLKVEIQEKQRELEFVRVAKVTSSVSQSGELMSKNELERLRRALADAEEARIKSESDKNHFRYEIEDLMLANETLNTELRNLYDLLETRKEENHSLIRRLNESSEEYSDLNKKFRELETEHMSLTRKYESFQREISHLSKTKESYREQAEKASLMLTKKNKELIDKIKDLDNLRSARPTSSRSRSPAGSARSTVFMHDTFSASQNVSPMRLNFKDN